LLLGLPYHGYAWALANPKENAIGALSSGLAVTQDGSMSYKYIKWYIRSYGATIIFDSTYVMNYCIIGSTWINFDDVEAIRAKIAYVKEKKLLGYNVFQVINDDNWVLSLAGTV
jgi:spore germination protein YaaH